MADQEKNNASPAPNEETIRLDYSLKSVSERQQLVDKIIKNTKPSKLTHKYLEILADYILDGRSKKEKKDKTILTHNRMVTINKRETSYEGLAEKFENGEDGLSNLILDADKNVYLTPKISITEEDIAEIPGLRELRDHIRALEATVTEATGKEKYLIKKAIIEMRRDQYVLKNSFKPPIAAVNTPHQSPPILEEKIIMNAENEPESVYGISLFNPRHISAILGSYSLLKEKLEYKINDDFFYFMSDFDEIKNAALAPYPLYQDIAELKICGKSGAEIQSIILDKYQKRFSIQHISALWKKKIPKLLAEKAKEKYLIWYYTFEERGKWKRCSRCGQVKLMHSKFFSKNNTSADGYYSVCKECRNKPKGGK